ncbi:MAG TPA: hypothetical protein VHX86_13560 [Tepidisphaeraceae bacterium]|jgi:hypothetical protein|nr:hypothetical protein [Tepidisphaeraceae bacterium]
MRVKYFILGAAGSFVLLLIVGIIFAIKAPAGRDDAGQIADSGHVQTPDSRNLNSQIPNGPTQAISDSGNDVDPAAAGYTVLASSDTGWAIFAQQPDSNTVQAAIVATLHDLTRMLDDKPMVQGAFADAQQQRRGGATFTGMFHGHAIRGTIMCGIGDKGAAVTVIYARADAPAADWAKLLAALPLDAQLQEHPIGDGAGTIGIPAGWKITSSSNVGAVAVTGPGRQDVSLGLGLEVVTPDSMAAATQRQLSYGGQVNPAMRLLVAPYTAPVDALKNLTPQLSEMSQSRGGPSIVLDQILETETVPAQLPGGQAQRIYFSSDHSQNGQTVHRRAWAQMECYPVGSGTWGIYCSEVSSPDASFDRDLPTMVAIAKSWKLNDSVVQQHTQQNIAAQNQRFAAFEQSMREKQDAFDSYLKSVQHNELIQERSNANFDEVIRGYRTVYDTETGQRTSADLGNVNEIVNSLNEYDPGRYVQIPLRDEEFPLNQGQ